MLRFVVSILTVCFFSSNVIAEDVWKCYNYTTKDLVAVDNDGNLKDICESYPNHKYNADGNVTGCDPSCSCCQQKGTWFTTISNRTCQRWDSQTPHKHDKNNVNAFPENTLADAHNYCRDPDRTDCYPNNKVRDYNGTWSVSQSGRRCQRWDSQSPHQHTRNNIADFPMDDILHDVHNYCRDPDGEGYPWCYTMDANKRWESCGISACVDVTTTTTSTTVTSTQVPETTSVPQNNTNDCYRYTEKDNAVILSNGGSEPEVCESYLAHVYTAGSNDEYPGCGTCTCCQTKDCYPNNKVRDYNGTWSISQSGRRCQRWDSQSPHQHNRNNIADFPMDDILHDVHNYCRDPDGEGYPWCYTMDANKRWESCGISACVDVTTTTTSTTVTSTQVPETTSVPQNNTNDCYRYTEKDKAVILSNGGSEPEVCESYLAHVYTAGSNYEYPGCGTCTCCQTKDCYPNNKVRDYNGTWSISQSGRRCQRWDSQSPHQHNRNNIADFPMDDILHDVHNYCRDPDGEGYPWCYTMDANKRWESCDIPACSEDDNVAFCAYLSEDFSSKPLSVTPIVYDEVLLNDGQAYEQNNGIFRAPVDAITEGYLAFDETIDRCVYMFTWTAYTNDEEADLQLVVSYNDSDPLGYLVAAAEGTSLHIDAQGGNTVMTHLKAGAMVWVHLLQGDRVQGGVTFGLDMKSYLTTFSGTLMYKDSKPKVSFNVFLNKDHNMDQSDDTQTVVMFDTIILNDGAGYCARTGTFIAPVEGVYLLTFSVGNVGVEKTNAELVIDDVNYTTGVVQGHSPSDKIQGGNTVITHLRKDSRAWINISTGNDVDSTWRYSSFSGTMLYEV